MKTYKEISVTESAASDKNVLKMYSLKSMNL